MNEIKKVILEKAIQKLDTNHIKQIFQNYSMVAAIEILNVDKNVDLLCKKKDYQFLSKLFENLKELPPSKFKEFIRITNQSFSIEKKYANIKVENNKTLNDFIIRVLDLSIFRKNNFTLDEIKKVVEIGNSFNIKEEKIVTWIGKMYAFSNNLEMITILKKENLLLDPKLQERFISVVLNIAKDTKVLDTLFKNYESKIYEIYTDYKNKNKIWNFLLPIKQWPHSLKILPYVSQEKLQWFENKQLGYNNNPTPFKLLNVFFEINSRVDMDKNLKLMKFIENEEYKTLIHDALIEYEKLILPMIHDAKDKYLKKSESPEYFKSSDEHSELRDKINQNMKYMILYVFYEYENIHKFCEKIAMKTSIEDTFLTQNTNLEKARKNLKI